jgi:hypothetical protein
VRRNTSHNRILGARQSHDLARHCLQKLRTLLAFLRVGKRGIRRPHRREPDVEPAKIFIRRGRWAALKHASYFLPPLLFAKGLLVINLWGLYINKEHEWFASLQYVAKLHEVWCQSSIATVLMTYVRHQLITYDDMPFASLFVPAQTAQLPYPFSTEFLGTLTGGALKGGRRLQFISLVLVSLIISATIGPSSAIAITPRSMLYNLPAPSANMTTFFLQDPDYNLFPDMPTFDDQRTV